MSYVEAKAAVKSRPRPTGNTTSYTDLRWGLERYGIAYEMNGRRPFRFTTWDGVPDRAIVAVECSPPSRAYWHWVVVDRVDGVTFVLDPSRRRAVRDVSRMRGRSYIAIRTDGPG